MKNILFLLVDQMRFDALSCNGAQICRTPNIDAIANEGVRFTQAYTTNALCSPARASILTGLYPHMHGQLANTGNFNCVFDKCMLEHETYFSRLKKEGYRTGYIGKWHLPKEGDRDFWKIDHWLTPDSFYAELREQGINFDFGINEVQPLEWGAEATFCGPSALNAEQHHDAWVARNTVDVLKAFGDSQPFVLCAAFHGPHFPIAVPEPYNTMYRPEDVPRWINFDEMFVNKPTIQQKELMRWNAAHLTWSDWQKVIATYWGYCTYIDDQIGRIVETLKRMGVYEDTTIVFTSDHGDMLGSHRLFNKGFNMYDEDYHIPLIVRAPGYCRTPVVDSFVSLNDVAPTFMDVAGIPHDASLHGRSLLALMYDNENAIKRDCILAEFNGYESTLASSRMIRTDKWKYIYNPFAEDELYDVVSDPGEMHNLAPLLGFSHVLRRMRDMMFAQLEAVEDGIIDVTHWQSNSYGLHLSGREK